LVFLKPVTPPKIPEKPICSITGLPAKYFDPLTKTPYATLEAFTIIRERFHENEVGMLDERIVDLNSMLEEKKKLKNQISNELVNSPPH